MLTETQYYNALNNFFGGDYSQLKKAREKFRSWKQVWQNQKTAINPAKKWEKLEKLKVKLILKEDSDYPALLKEISAPPFGIYFSGDPSYKAPAVAIVGTRTATPQGKEIARSFGKRLSEAGLTIVSGLALGIDACAHQGAIDGSGKTIAVLGTPLSNIYPKQNENLAKQILEKGGAIISEFPFEKEIYPPDFLIRNRIISGLSDAVLVIEAPEKSGALATAKFALEQNREIFVIPGGITAQNYKGSNALIKAGATPVTSPEDILDYFQIKQTDFLKNDSQTNAADNPILRILKQKGELTLEQILNESLLEVSELNKNLGRLVIRGIIKESNGKYSL